MRMFSSKLLAVAAVIVGHLVASSTALSQAPTSFEVASVRRVAAPGTLKEIAASSIRVQPNGQLTGTIPLKSWIAWAYGLAPYQTIEGSFRELEQVFSVAARGAETKQLSAQEFGPVNVMMQVLLAERFGLKVRWESRSQTVLVLRQVSAGKLGPKVKRLEVDCSTAARTVPAIRGCRSEVRTKNGYMHVVVPRMADFADFLATMGERAIVDETGLIGPFEFETIFEAGSLNVRLTERIPSAAKPSLTNALRDDLGLKLDSERRGVPVLIVEHVQPPTEN